MKSGDFHFETRANVNASCGRRKRDWLAVWQGGRRSGVVELLPEVRSRVTGKLIGESVASPGPVVGQSCHRGSHRMIRMSGDRAFESHGYDNVRPELSDVQDQVRDNPVQFDAV